jgi:hypothetical protein
MPATQLEHFSTSYDPAAQRILTRLRAFSTYIAKTGAAPMEFEQVFGPFVRNWATQLGEDGPRLAVQLARAERVRRGGKGI